MAKKTAHGKKKTRDGEKDNDLHNGGKGGKISLWKTDGQGARKPAGTSPITKTGMRCKKVVHARRQVSMPAMRYNGF